MGDYNIKTEPAGTETSAAIPKTESSAVTEIKKEPVESETAKKRKAVSSSEDEAKIAEKKKEKKKKKKEKKIKLEDGEAADDTTVNTGGDTTVNADDTANASVLDTTVEKEK